MEYNRGDVVELTGTRILVTGPGNVKEAGYACFSGFVVHHRAYDEDEVNLEPFGLYSETWRAEAPWKKIDNFKIPVSIESYNSLLDALKEAKQIIRTWHGMGMDPGAEQQAWNIYNSQSPEMKRINEAISNADKLLVYSGA